MKVKVRFFINLDSKNIIEDVREFEFDNDASEEKINETMDEMWEEWRNRKFKGGWEEL